LCGLSGDKVMQPTPAWLMVAVTALAASMLLLLAVGVVLMVRDTVRRQGRWGINLKPARSTRCRGAAPGVRAPTNLRQAPWGGVGGGGWGGTGGEPRSRAGRPRRRGRRSGGKTGGRTSAGPTSATPEEETTVSDKHPTAEPVALSRRDFLCTSGLGMASLGL